MDKIPKSKLKSETVYSHFRIWKNIPDNIKFSPLNYFEGIFAFIADGYGNRVGEVGEILGNPIYVLEKNLDEKFSNECKIYLEVYGNRFSTV